MALLRIPDRYVGGLAKFFKLSDEDSEKLFASIERIPICSKPRNAIKDAVAELSTLPQGDVESIADAVMSLFSIWNYEFKSSSELAQEVVEAIDVHSSEELKFSQDIRSKITPRLIRLFSMSAIAVSVKASARRVDYDNVFSYARISSDIRPVFDLNANDRPRVAVLAHSLNIHYLHESDHKDFYIALDDEDLLSLKKHVERAILKAENLKSFLKSAQLEYVGPE